MPQPQLDCPPPGELLVARGFMPTDMIDEANAAVNDRTAAGNVWNDTTMAHLEQKLTVQQPFKELARHIVNANDNLKARRMSMGIRRMGIVRGREIRSDIVHVDRQRDVRVVVEGDKSTWVFDQQRMLKQYPYGIMLVKGDAIVLNNLCDDDRQVRHGVNVAADTMLRRAYIFRFI